MKKPNFRTPFNHKFIPEKISNLPSLTIPDQTLTVKELIQRHVRGLPLDGEKVPIYYGEDEEMPDLARMDLSEIQDLKEQTADTIRKHEKAEEKRVKDKKQKDYDDEIERRVQEKINILKKPSPPGNEGTKE